MLNVVFFYISIVVALCVSIIEYKVTPNQYIFELKLLPANEFSGDILKELSYSKDFPLNQQRTYNNIYNDIVYSTPFLMDVLNTEIKWEHKIITIGEYLKSGQKISCFSRIKGLPMRSLSYLLSLLKREKKKGKDTLSCSIDSSNNHFYLSNDDMNLIIALKNAIQVKKEKRTGVFIVKVEVQNIYVAGRIAETVKENLNKYILKYNRLFYKSEYKYSKSILDSIDVHLKRSMRHYSLLIESNRNVVKTVYYQSLLNAKEELQRNIELYNKQRSKCLIDSIRSHNEEKYLFEISRCNYLPHTKSISWLAIGGEYLLIALCFSIVYSLKGIKTLKVFV